MGALPREMATRPPTAVLGGETASLLDAPRAVPEGDPFSRAFETGRRVGGYTVIEERTGGGPEGPPDLSLDGFQSYHAQPPSSSLAPSSTYSPLPERHRSGAMSSSSSKKRAKTRFPSLTPSTLAPAPGNFSASGDTRAAEAVAHARKTWAPPALRTQAIASYGAVPDLEIIPENIEVDRFQKRRRIGGYSELGCPTCAIS